MSWHRRIEPNKHINKFDSIYFYATIVDWVDSSPIFNSAEKEQEYTWAEEMTSEAQALFLEYNRKLSIDLHFYRLLNMHKNQSSFIWFRSEIASR
jgi:hypothetical protein